MSRYPPREFVAENGLEEFGLYVFTYEEGQWVKVGMDKMALFRKQQASGGPVNQRTVLTPQPRQQGVVRFTGHQSTNLAMETLEGEPLSKRQRVDTERTAEVLREYFFKGAAERKCLDAWDDEY